MLGIDKLMIPKMSFIAQAPLQESRTFTIFSGIYPVYMFYNTFTHALPN